MSQPLAVDASDVAECLLQTKSLRATERDAEENRRRREESDLVRGTADWPIGPSFTSQHGPC